MKNQPVIVLDRLAVIFSYLNESQLFTKRARFRALAEEVPKDDLLNRHRRCARCIATKATPSLRTCQRVAASQRNTAASRECVLEYVFCNALLPTKYAAFCIPPPIKKHAHADARLKFANFIFRLLILYGQSNLVAIVAVLQHCAEKKSFIFQI